MKQIKITDENEIKDIPVNHDLLLILDFRYITSKSIAWIHTKNSEIEDKDKTLELEIRSEDVYEILELVWITTIIKSKMVL